MAVSATELLDRVGADAEDQQLAEKIVTLAPLFVARYRAAMAADPQNLPTVPDEVLDHATLACAEDIFTRTKSQNGVVLTNFQPGDDGSGVTIRIGRDPLAPVRPLLTPWIPTVFAL